MLRLWSATLTYCTRFQLVPPGFTNISGLNRSWPSGNRCRYSFGFSNLAKGAWAQKQIWAATAQFRLRGCRSNPGVGHWRAYHLRIQAYTIYDIQIYKIPYTIIMYNNLGKLVRVIRVSMSYCAQSQEFGGSQSFTAQKKLRTTPIKKIFTPHC